MPGPYYHRNYPYYKITEATPDEFESGPFYEIETNCPVERLLEMFNNNPAKVQRFNNLLNWAKIDVLTLHHGVYSYGRFEYDKGHNTLLKVALLGKPTASKLLGIQRLLQSIIRLKDEWDRAGLLGSFNSDSDALTLALRWEPRSVHLILDAIRYLDKTNQALILNRFVNNNHLLVKGDDLRTIFNLMVENEHITSDQVYRCISRHPNSHGFSRILQYKLIMDMEKLLDRLTSNDEQAPINVLREALKQDLKIFKEENKTKEDTSTFTKTFTKKWSEKIQIARNDDTIKGQPDVMGVLKTMLLVLSVIGIVFLSYQANENKKKNRSMFFPSSNEKIVNALEDIAKTLNPRDEPQSDPLNPRYEP